MRINGINHVAIICSDYQKSKDFYVRVLGFSIKAEHYRKERKSFKLDLEIQGLYQIELFSFENSPERPSHPEARGLRHLAFSVENLAPAVRELQLQGIDVEPVRTDEYTGKKYTFFRDPDDLPLELYES